ncbi:hypothetical protein [Flavobacterium algicola]|uniref:hypothetical protein n=1 Tax=Flavobacterium algicola TaxID=556529 RepID=UPI001EFC5C38|nr:hypothetical protein [Flavobacterium algicola]MCG9792705.1 hypothetical protein [Flavobacterium algicola]
MDKSTMLFLILSVLVAGGLSFIQYLYKAKSDSRLNFLLAFLRFLSLLAIFILLINPIFTTNKLETVKPPLAIIVDNSSSIKYLSASESASDIYTFLVNNKDLADKFAIQSFRFDSEFIPSSSFNYKGNQTNFDGISKNLKNYYRSQTYPSIVITDGNQTHGNDYVYAFDNSNKVYPIVVGDTTKVFDLKIGQLNVNKYAFYKNKFPVEVFLNYSGTKAIQADLIITQGKSIVAKQKVSLSSMVKNTTVNLLLPADRKGVQIYKAKITTSEKEKNTYNNVKNFAVEVLDQKTNIAIITEINHPDIAALKRAIETNEQRKVTIVKPNEISNLSNYAVCIFYQPTSKFKVVFEEIDKVGINAFIITGMHTNYNFLNQTQDYFDFKMSSQPEDFTVKFEEQFNLFAAENIGFENLPPLENPFGKITVKNLVSTALSAKIRNIETGAPLLAFGERQGKRSAFLFGENSWRWRLQSNIDQQSFDKYDLFVDKIIQFLSSNNTKKSLVVNHENFYNSGESIEINAQFFNKNYEFDEKAHLTISVKNEKSKQVKNYDLLKSNSFFKVNLDGLTAGSYSFVVKELNTKTIYSNSFEILDFDIEKQFVNADAEKLNQLATQTAGKLYFPNQMEQLVQSLLSNSDYQAVQKKHVSRSPLIDWYWLLIIIAATLSAEWFIRKYNGLL